MITIVDRAIADTDYTIAYLDEQPIAVVEADEGGCFAALHDGQYVKNQGDERYWWVDGGRWHNAYARTDALVDVMAGYQLKAVGEDGNQEVYDGPLEAL